MLRKETPEDIMMRTTLKEDSESLDRMIAMVNDAKKIGVGTLAELDDQGRQIGVIRDDIDEIQYRDKFAKRQLRSISSFFWDLLYSIVPFPKWRKRIHEKIVSNEKQKSTTAKVNEALGGDIIADALKNDPNLQDYKKTDAKLDQVGRGVKDLHKIAEDMHDEITDQNFQLDELQKDTHDTIVENAALIKRENGLLKRFT